MVEHVHRQVVGFLPVFVETLLSEVEVGCKLSAFVVASEHDYFFGSGYFHGENEEKDLD